ncbi:MAG: hypothetical protein CM1200mP29_13290 [Verrucomicrobiota bacterium]|nr:MAG: hypothetical protein CM1200mP29_13290 [Verrucomicrobiota bacterium]
MIVYDLNQDSLRRLSLPVAISFTGTKGNGQFQHKPMLENPIMPLGEAGILSDFNGDGHLDFISTGKEDGLLRLWTGTPSDNLPPSRVYVFTANTKTPHKDRGGYRP